MSRTIETNSGSEFFTNISAEEFLGRICRDIGVKHYYNDYGGGYEYMTLAYSMTEEEALDAAKKLRDLVDNGDIYLYYSKYKPYFGDDTDIIEFKDSLIYYAELFEESKGYECLG